MIYETYPEDARIMIVAHGAMNKALLKNIRGLEMKDLWYGRLHAKIVRQRFVKLYKDGFEVVDESRIFYSL